MNESQLNAANIILSITPIESLIDLDTIKKLSPQAQEIHNVDFSIAASELESHELLYIDRKPQLRPDHYRLTNKGHKLAASGKKFEDFINDLEEKKAQQAQKEETEKLLKEKQLQEIEFKLKTMEDTLSRQQAFWDSGINRDKRQKWQYWITTILAILAFGLSIYNAFNKK